MPLVLFWLWHSMTLLRNAIRGSRLMKTLLYVLCATSCLSPLFLHALAWDLQRFNCLAQVTGFLVFTSLRYRSKASGKALQLHSSTPTLVLASMFMLNVSADVPLLNRYEVARPPFWRHFYHLRAYVKGDTPFVVVPGTQQMPRQRAADQLRGAGGAKRRSTLRASCRCGSGAGSRWTRSTRHRLLTTTAFRLVSMDVV